MIFQKRNSSLELLRIFCTFGILCMHLSGIFNSSDKTVTLTQLNAINSLFNICVTCFVLLSGYFGINRKPEKLFSLWCIVMFYSLLSATISLFFSSTIDFVFLFKSVFPTITSKYWYWTTYFLLALFSPYINKIPELLTQKQFKTLLTLLILAFYICPTFFYFEIIKDNGKGPVNMLIVYLIGRYIGIYQKETATRQTKIILCFVGSISTAFLLNLTTSILRGRPFAPFARDNSIFMLVSALCLFHLCRSMTFSSKMVNLASRNTFAVYIGEGILRSIFNVYLPLSALDGKWYLVPRITGLAASIFLAISLFEFLRSAIFHRLENWLFSHMKKIFTFLIQLMYKKGIDRIQ